MAHNRIEVPVHIYDRFLYLQHQILAHEIEADEAREQMIDLLAPYVAHMPDELDTTEIVMAHQIISMPGVMSHASIRKEIH